MGRTNTPRLGISVPDINEPDNVPADLTILANVVDGLAPIASGLLSDLPDATQTPIDSLFYAYDQPMLYRCSGSDWDEIGPSVILDGSVTTSKLADGAVTAAKAGVPLGQFATGVFATPLSTGLFDIAGLPFQPKMVDFTWMSANSATVFTQGHGAATSPSQRWAMFARGTGGPLTALTMDQVYVNNRCIYHVDDTVTALVSADFGGFNSDGFALNFSVATVAINVGWKAYA